MHSQPPGNCCTLFLFLPVNFDMITKDEINQKAEEFEIHHANVQRDYVFGWVLAGIYGASDLKDVLVLKGGGCFRKGYFEHTRFTNDLDFSTERKLDQNLLASELNKVCNYVHKATGITFDNERNNVRQKMEIDDEKRVFEARVFFKDFYGNPDACTIKISMDVIEFDKIYLPIQSRQLIHPYSDWQDCRVEIHCQKLEELLANKLKCLLQRRHSHDLYDFVYSFFLNKEVDVNRAEIVSTIFKKTIYEGNPHLLRDLLIALPFEVFRAAWHKYLFCPKPGLLAFEIAVEQFKSFISEIFSPLSVRRNALAYCPAHVRNPIMDAGSNQTLVEVDYGGYKRIVEPYALVYKRRQDGVGREYFYGFDRTGGRSGQQSIKSFIASDIQSVRDTGETFEPRHEIELSKAGEVVGNAYFSKPFPNHPRSAKAPRLPHARKIKTGIIKPRRSTIGIYKPKSLKYEFRCGVCNKSFLHKSNSSKLGEHKDKYRNRCFGRTGYMVGTKYC